jgi:carbon-monoxide dehydrogenase small subunit
MSRRLIPISLTVNGQTVSSAAEPRRSLADLLRHDLDLTGTHVGCEHGVCGACTVLVDGLAVRSCLMLAVQADGRDVTTIEGLRRNGSFHPLQAAFRDSHSFQCGFCTPGFVMSTYGLLSENPEPTDEELRSALSSNLCRCTGYQSILAGARLGADRMADERSGRDG